MLKEIYVLQKNITHIITPCTKPILMWVGVLHHKYKILLLFTTSSKHPVILDMIGLHNP